ncbi:MAG: helix-turn-helix domain-containing protein [Eubacteriaceae bacterium]|nr:helix-turn-helix domain-containing protein [Eubacteriaceae bacterium]
MLFIAENLKNLHKGKDLTQEEVAEKLSVSTQSVSKWERSDTLRDITLLPALANLYKVTEMHSSAWTKSMTGRREPLFSPTRTTIGEAVT